MGYGYYTVNGWGKRDGGWTAVSRPAGYMVLATCDKRGCDNEIDRGLGYLCGSTPHGPFDMAEGCGRYYCGDHSGWVGPRGGCSHGNRGYSWGRTLSDMVPNEDGTVVCLDPTGHDGPHAWAVVVDEPEASARGAEPR